jgi:hypothetical protein
MLALADDFLLQCLFCDWYIFCNDILLGGITIVLFASNIY